MATTLYFIAVGEGDGCTLLTGYTKLAGGSPASHTNSTLSTTRGSSLVVGSANTVSGPTAGIEITNGTQPYLFVTPPLASDITISGSITWNIWAQESSMNANVAINGILWVSSGATGTFTEIDRTARTTELGFSGSRTVQNFSETPAAGIACKKGDRLVATIFGDDAGTMGSGFTFDVGVGGTTASADGDTFLTLTENVTFDTATPSGTQVFLTDTASSVSTASVDREAWTSRGAGAQTDVTNTAAGPTSGIQVTDTAGGTVVDWFTKPLAATTIGGRVTCNVWANESNAAANASVRVEIALVDFDGTNATVWASGTNSGEIPVTTSTAQGWVVSGDDLSVAPAQRLRIRLYVDDATQSTLVTGHTVTTNYAGTSGGATGDTYFTFSQTLTEYTEPAGTKLYLRNAFSDYQTGTNDANLRGTSTTWINRLASTTAGSSATASGNTTTATGPHAGIEAWLSSGFPNVWWTAPLDADVTISGEILWNVWASENSASANVAINGILEVVDGATGTITEIHRTSRTTEVAVSTRAVNYFPETPASGVACKRGDRLRIRIYGDDAGTMAQVFNFNIGYDGPTAGADGDTWLKLTESLTFGTPAGSTYYPASTISDVVDAQINKTLTTVAPSGANSDQALSVTGWTAPIQVKENTASAEVSWYTPQLEAFTLGGSVTAALRGLTTASCNVALRAEIAVCNSDGGGATVWAAGTQNAELTTSFFVNTITLGGDDVAVTQGQRLRLRVYIDDYNQDGAMITGETVSFSQNTSLTFLTFTQTLVEFSATTDILIPKRHRGYIIR